MLVVFIDSSYHAEEPRNCLRSVRKDRTRFAERITYATVSSESKSCLSLPSSLKNAKWKLNPCLRADDRLSPPSFAYVGLSFVTYYQVSPVGKYRKVVLLLCLWWASDFFFQRRKRNNYWRHRSFLAANLGSDMILEQFAWFVSNETKKDWKWFLNIVICGQLFHGLKPPISNWSPWCGSIEGEFNNAFCCGCRRAWFRDMI